MEEHIEALESAIKALEGYGEDNEYGSAVENATNLFFSEILLDLCKEIKQQRENT
jgi:hypothetical protein